MNILSSFVDTDLQGLDSIKLLNRVDTKFVFHQDSLSGLLEKIAPHYKVLCIDGVREFRYETLYFDTPSLQLYREHHNGKPNRMKVRCRHYVDTGDVFFEVKYKVAGLRTDKVRRHQDAVCKTLEPQHIALIKGYEQAKLELQPQLWTNFHRITLAGIDVAERVTIDLNLSFDDFKQEKKMDNLVICEMKQDKASLHSPLINALRQEKIAAVSISKYAVGTAFLKQDIIKTNAFKPTFLKLKRLLNGYSS